MYRSARKANNSWDVDWKNPINADNPVNTGRFAWWLVTKNNYGGPSWFDLVRSSVGTLTNMGSGFGWTANGPTGFPGSMLFNGSSSYVNTPFTLTSGGTNAAGMTVYGWIQMAAAPSGYQCLLMTRTPNFMGTLFGTAAGNPLCVSWNQTGFDTATGLIPVANTWQFFATSMQCTFTGIQFSCYLSTGGASLPSFSYSIGLSNQTTSAWNIGRDPASAGFFNGRIAEIGIYNRNLSASEIGLLFRLGQQGYPGVLNRRKKTAWFLRPASPPPAVSSRPIAAYTRKGVVIGTGIF